LPLATGHLGYLESSGADQTSRRASWAEYIVAALICTSRPYRTRKFSPFLR
jgi:hypothetical protein